MLPALVTLICTAGAAVLPEPIAPMERALRSARPKISAKTAFAYRLARSGPEALDLLGTSVTPRGLSMHLQFDHDVTLAELAAVPCTLARSADGVPAVVGPIADAFCPWEVLEQLARVRGLVRAEPTLGRKILRPMLPKATTLDVTGVTRAVELGWPQRNGGDGVLIADMDTGFNPFHPLHFKADGSHLQWVDVDGDGVFTAGTDAVDFNGNGTVDVGETLRALKPDFYSEYTFEQFSQPGAFVAGVDWLYLDENNNGMRDYGASFGDAKPTFGEQLFVADDVNGNGTLDPGEPIVALETPRIRAISTPGHVYRRGVDLSQYKVTDEQHASMVLGTLAGGDLELTRYHGAAPNAEIVMAENTDTDLVQSAAWAKSEGAQIMLWEMATWYLEYLDGSSAHETACDSLSTTDGILQLAAAGNLGTSKKHFKQTIAAGASAPLPITVPATTPAYLIATLLWRGGNTISATAQWGDQTLPLTGAGGQGALGVAQVTWQIDTSSRGTNKIDLYVVLSGGRPAGDLSLTFANQNAADVDLLGFLEDPDSGWGLGVAWDLASVTDEGTYGTPAVGDHTLAVATWQVDWPYQVMSGQLAFWSGRGPRLDGADTIDFATPEDHWTAPYAPKTANGVTPPFGSYFVGGGTSNALPMATGIAAVLLSANPTWKAQELTDALHHGAGADSFTGTVPNDQWGLGKLSAYRALEGMDPPAHTAPTAVGTAVRRDGTLFVDATGSTGDTLQYRWDLGVDGTFELAPSSDVMAQLPDASSTKWVELQVIDAEHFTAAIVVPIVDEVTTGAIAKPEVLGAALKQGCGCDSGALPAVALAAALLLLRRRRQLISAS